MRKWRLAELGNFLAQDQRANNAQANAKGIFSDWVSGFREDGLEKGEQTLHNQGNQQIEVYICIIFFNLCPIQLHICLPFIFSNK